MRQNSDFSPNPDAFFSCERPHRRPIAHTPVTHKGMIAELHNWPETGFKLGHYQSDRRRTLCASEKRRFYFVTSRMCQGRAGLQLTRGSDRFFDVRHSGGADLLRESEKQLHIPRFAGNFYYSLVMIIFGTAGNDAISENLTHWGRGVTQL